MDSRRLYCPQQRSKCSEKIAEDYAEVNAASDLHEIDTSSTQDIKSKETWKRLNMDAGLGAGLPGTEKGFARDRGDRWEFMSGPPRVWMGKRGVCDDVSSLFDGIVEL